MFGVLEGRHTAPEAVSKIVRSFSARRLRNVSERLVSGAKHDSPFFSIESSTQLQEVVRSGLQDEFLYSPSRPASLVSDPDRLKALDSLFQTDRSLGFFDLEKSSTWIETDLSSEKISKYHAALRIIEESAPELFELFNMSVSHVIPVGAVTPKKTFGFTSRQTIGFVFVDFSDKRDKTSASQFALDIIHEATHCFVDILLQADSLLTRECPESLYSPIRKTMRHSFGTLHGALALSSMKTLTERIRASGDLKRLDESDLAEFDKEFLIGLRTCLDETFPDSYVTKVGKLLLDECRRVVS